MRWIVIAILSGLTGCGMSVEEKTNVAAATCSLLSEYSESDGVARMKEINSAREKLQQPLFLGSGEDIQDALEYGLCNDLVLNNSEYNIRLAEATQPRVEKFQQFLGGAWFSAHEATATERERFVVAEFLGEDLVLSNYSYNEDSEQERRELSLRTKVLSNSQIIASGSDKDDFIVHLDWDRETIRLGAFDCSLDGTCNFIKAPKVSLEDIEGKWLQSNKFADDNLWLSEYLEDSARYYWRNFDHKNKTYEDGIDDCGFRLESGFVFVDLCNEAEPFYFLITKYLPSKMETFVYGEFYEEVRVRSEYEFPEPPSGYKEVATK